MKKFSGILLLLLGILVLFTGCSSEKQCAKWETKSNGTIRDCSKIKGYYEKMDCELKNDKVSSTQECVEWVE